MFNRYPHTSDPETPEAQRVAALAKSVAAVAVVGVIAVLAGLHVRDERRTDNPRVGENVVLHAAAGSVESTAPAAFPSGVPASASDDLHKFHFNPDAVNEFQATVDY